MVKNRAQKHAARSVKASAGITYPRALNSVAGSQGLSAPSLFVGWKPNGEAVSYQPARGSVLAIAGYSGSGQSVLMRRLAVQAAAEGLEVHVIDILKEGGDYRDLDPGLINLHIARNQVITALGDLSRKASGTTLVFVDYLYNFEPYEDLRQALVGASEAGVPVIAASQRVDLGLPRAMWDRATRILTGRVSADHLASFFRTEEAPSTELERFRGVMETPEGVVHEVALPPGGQRPDLKEIPGHVRDKLMRLGLRSSTR